MSGKPRASQGGGSVGNAGAPRSAQKQPRGPPRQSNNNYAPANTQGGDDEQQPTKLGSAQGDKKIAAVQTKIDAVRDVMSNNMELAITRGERLETIEQKSDVLLEDANKFQSQSAATKKMFCRRNVRNMIIIAVIAAVMLGLIIWAAR
jgi:hypothetical protein